MSSDQPLRYVTTRTPCTHANAAAAATKAATGPRTAAEVPVARARPAMPAGTRIVAPATSMGERSWSGVRVSSRGAWALPLLWPRAAAARESAHTARASCSAPGAWSAEDTSEANAKKSAGVARKVPSARHARAAMRARVGSAWRGATAARSASHGAPRTARPAPARENSAPGTTSSQKRLRPTMRKAEVARMVDMVTAHAPCPPPIVHAAAVMPCAIVAMAKTAARAA
mmetsp:Transcript_4702/g.13641  ORF Transcript_4702/g.13641 Transcript_4702/m.13641 type:complete len:229 (-) Transcript_4702:123-809(-)